MRLLLDTHFVIALGQGELAQRYPNMLSLIEDDTNTVVISVCSLWEIAIKARLGKLEIAMPVDALSDVLEEAGFAILDITRRHVAQSLEPEPQTADPFDRLLLAQCQAESMELATVDRALVDHPLAFKPQ